MAHDVSAERAIIADFLDWPGDDMGKLYEKAVKEKLQTMGLYLATDKPGWYVRVSVDVGEGPVGFTVWATDVKP
jgi:hypothetical protein